MNQPALSPASSSRALPRGSAEQHRSAGGTCWPCLAMSRRLAVDRPRGGSARLRLGEGLGGGRRRC